MPDKSTERYVVTIAFERLPTEHCITSVFHFKTLIMQCSDELNKVI